MATTAETAIIWTIVLMSISGVSTMINFMGPPGTNFYQVEDSFIQSLMVSPDDLNALVIQYQSPVGKESDSVPVNTFIFINQALATGGFLLKSAFNIAFGWIGLVTVGVGSVGLPSAFALVIIFTIVAPLLIIEMYGFMEIAFLMKRLIPFLG